VEVLKRGTEDTTVDLTPRRSHHRWMGKVRGAGMATAGQISKDPLVALT
jgi:hypothetical protein